MGIHADDFVPVSFENKGIIDSYLAQYPHGHSESSPVTMLSWEHYCSCYFTEYCNHLIIEVVMDGVHLLHAPIGALDPAIFEDEYVYAKSIGADIAIYDEDSCAMFRSLHPETKIEEVRGYFEYCWYAETLAELRGKEFVGIRGQINRFLKEYTYTVEPITVENKEEVRAMIHQWGAEKKTSDDSLMHDELIAVDISLDHYDELHLEGILLRIDTEIGAVAIWEKNPGDVVMVHYEKGLQKYPGIYKIINLETAKYLKNRYKIINRESDVDNPGLREAKLRYHPDFFIKAYLIKTSD
ncbi:MAG TPA: phosphatidylglycerol lysyltransferase domain-containing protein [Methanocorpusculum sp.]|nr:phosphatidylglycerol lysyltransferase domain-containing protein [Methanocorpusculum sp.]